MKPPHEEFASYIAHPEALNSVPIEYYKVVWESFAGAALSGKSVSAKKRLSLTPGSILSSYAANKYAL